MKFDFSCRTGWLRYALAFASFSALTSSSIAQLRVATYNVTNYTGGRVSQFQTIFYSSFNGRSFAPDVVLGQEFTSVSAVNAFRDLLNTAPGSPGDWQAAPFIDGADTEGEFFYRTSKVDFLGVTTVAIGSPDPTNQPRNTYRYDVRLKGYTDASATIALYCSHMKAGSTTTDQARRLVEATRVRSDAEKLPAGWKFIIGGDFNTQSSSQDAYQMLVGSQSNNNGQFFDPIKTPGSWNNNSSYHFVHTQDPSGAGMDDRFDFLLVSSRLIDGGGIDYIGNSAIPYSTTTWNDPNHSYRCWGNDGTSYGNTLTITGNSMVGATIAQALKDSALTGGHLPVYMDIKVPAKVTATGSVEFGNVPQFVASKRPFTVQNSGDTSLWNIAGISNLNYSIEVTGPYYVRPGNFTEAPGGGFNTHYVALATNTLGDHYGTVTITPTSPANADWTPKVIQVHAKVVPSGFGINP